MEFTPDPAYQAAAAEQEMVLARKRIVYLSACLMQVQAEATAEIARLSTEIEKRDNPQPEGP